MVQKLPGHSEPPVFSSGPNGDSGLAVLGAPDGAKAALAQLDLQVTQFGPGKLWFASSSGTRFAFGFPFNTAKKDTPKSRYSVSNIPIASSSPPLTNIAGHFKRNPELPSTLPPVLCLWKEGYHYSTYQVFLVASFQTTKCSLAW